MMSSSMCDCGFPRGTVIKGKDEPPGSCLAGTRWGTDHEQYECHLRQITKLERERDELQSKLNLLEAQVPAMCNSAEARGYANGWRAHQDSSLDEDAYYDV